MARKLIRRAEVTGERIKANNAKRGAKGTPHKRTPRKRMTAEERAAQKAANRAEYRAIGEELGDDYMPGEKDETRHRERLRPEEMTEAALKRARGDRSDEDCANEVIELISSGKTVKWACASCGLSPTQYRAWVTQDRWGLIKRHRVALQLQAEAWADDLVDEAEEASHDNYRGHQLRIETKKWLMGRNHGKYNDRGNGPVEESKPAVPYITEGMTEREAAEAYAATIRRNR